jgi:hypothetical protein
LHLATTTRQCDPGWSSVNTPWRKVSHSFILTTALLAKEKWKLDCDNQNEDSECSQSRLYALSVTDYRDKNENCEGSRYRKPRS